MNCLWVNPSKTEFLIIGNSQQRNKIQSSSIVFCGNIISPSTSARNLGVTFDSCLSLTEHISSICKSVYYQIRQLRQIRSSLDIFSAIILANSLVISKLDYLLLNELPKSSINHLTFKVLKFQQPACIYDLITPYIPPWSLRSSNKILLIVPDIRAEIGLRSFSFAAPTFLNSLPQHIRTSDSLPVFRGLLKTYLYQKSLPS